MRKGKRKKWLAKFLVFTMAVQTIGMAVPMRGGVRAAEAGSNDILFHDFETENVGCTEGGSLTTDQKHDGEKSLELKYAANDSNKDIIIDAKNETFDVSNQEYLTFWIKDSGSNTVRVKLIDNDGKESEKWTPNDAKSIPGEWTLMSLPLSSFTNLDLTNITKVAIYEWNAGTYYIDDIQFVKELPQEEEYPMNGTATWFQNFEEDPAENTFSQAQKGVTASVKEQTGCEDSKGLVYEKEESKSPETDDGSVVVKSAEPVDTTGLRYLIFYIKDTQGSNTLKVSLIDSTGKETDFGSSGWVELSTSKNEWKQYYVLLGDRKGIIDRTKITGVRIGEWNPGTYYIDNVYFDNYLFTGTPDSGNTAPTFGEGDVKVSIEPGKITKTTDIELIASDPDAFIYYTVDGTDPQMSSDYLYKGVIPIPRSTTIKAIAVKNNTPSNICTFDYSFELSYPVTATEEAGEYTDQVVVEFRTQNDKDLIYYTTDGSEPKRGESNTTQFIKPMLLTKSTTFKAIAYNTQSDGQTEKSYEFKYTIIPSGKTAAPIFSKPEGTYGDAINIELKADGDIYYTTDGSNPTTASTKYTKAIKVEKNMVICAIAVKDGKESETIKAEYVINKEKTPFLKADGKVLKDNYGTGDVITLRGTNAGGWLVTEDWQCPVNAKDQLTMQKTFTERFGAETSQELVNLYQDGWWTEEDFDLVKDEGMNVLRLPVTYFEMLKEDGTLKETAFERLEWFVKNCEKRGLYVLIDMHGAVGSQNGKDHSGDTTIANVGNFYGNEENIAKTIKLWEEIVKKYKDNPWVCGYDLLNEPSAVGTVQFKVYDRIYKAIRAIDKNHPIYIQSIWEPTHLPDPSYYGWQNVVYEYHFYGWNVETDAEGQKEFIQSKVKMVNEDTKYDVPLLVGEFSFFSTADSWKAMDTFEEQGWSYTSWTFKVTDGGEGSSWGIYTAKNEGRKVDIYNDSLEDIQKKWSAKNLSTKDSFTRNTKFADILKEYFANNKNNKAGMTDATDIELDEKTLTLEVNKTGKLNAKVIPENTTYKTLYFSTSDPSIAEVDANGTVTAIATGTAIITATNLYGMSKICTITVKANNNNDSENPPADDGSGNGSGSSSSGNSSSGNGSGSSSSGNSSSGVSGGTTTPPADTNQPTDSNTTPPTDTSNIETKPDGTVVKTEEKTNTDGTKTTTITETTADGKVIKESVTETAADGSAVATTKTTMTNSLGTEVSKVMVENIKADGSITQTTEESTFSFDNAETVVTTVKDNSGNLTEASASISKQGETTVTGKTKLTISSSLTNQIAESAGTTDVDIVVSVKDDKDKLLYNLAVNKKKLESGNSLYLYGYDEKTGTYTMINAVKYKVVDNKDLIIKAAAGRDYTLLDKAEMNRVSKQIMKTVKLAASQKTKKTGKSFQVTLHKKANKDSIKKIVYTTSDNKIATVTKKGQVKTKAKGTVKVNAKVTMNNGKTKTLTMKVKVKK